MKQIFQFLTSVFSQFLLIVSVLGTLPVSAPAQAAGRAPARSAAATGGGRFGLGLIIGEPTGLSMKYWLDSRAAFQGALAFSFDDYFLISGDYLYHYPGAFGQGNAFVSQLQPYFGVGGVVVFTTTDRRVNDRFLGRRSGSVGVGVRVPLGIEWNPGRPSLGIFAELVPGISLVPLTSAFFEAGIGIRYYF